MRLERHRAASALCSLLLAAAATPHAAGQRRGRAVKSPPARRAASQGFRFTRGDAARGIPFDLYDGGIMLKARVNGAPVTLSMDTGAGGIFAAVGAETAKRLGLAPRGGYKVGGVGGEFSVQTADGATVSLPGVEFTNRRIEIVPLGTDDPGEPHLDGGFGGDLFKQFVTEIDFAGRVINLYAPARYRYAGRGAVVPVTIDGDGKPVVSLSMRTPEGADIEGRFIVDLGLSGTLAFFGPAVRKHRLIRSTRTIEAPASAEMGGEYRRRIGRLKSLQLGGVRIDNPTVSYSTAGGEGGDADGVLGMEILRRFRVVIDYTRGRFILEPNSAFSEPYEEDMSGLALAPALDAGHKVFKVSQVLAGTPASEAGLRAGDLITAIDGRPASVFNVDRLARLLKNDGREIKLSFKRDGRDAEAAIRLRRLI